MPADFTVLGATRLLTSYIGDGSVSAKNMFLALLRDDGSGSMFPTNPRTTTAYTGTGSWTAKEATFPGYGRVQLTGGSSPKMGTIAANGAVVELTNSSEVSWVTNTGANLPQTIIGFFICTTSNNTASGTIDGVFGYASLDTNQTVTAANQVLRFMSGDLLITVG